MSLDMLKELTEVVTTFSKQKQDNSNENNDSNTKLLPAQPEQKIIPQITAPQNKDPNFDEYGNPITILGMLKKFNIKYTINNDKLDVIGDIDISFYDQNALPVPFNIVKKGHNQSGSVYMSGGTLTSFINFPVEVEGSVEVPHNQISTFNHCPRRIGESLIANSNNFTNIENISEFIGDTLDLSQNYQLKSLHNIHKYLKHVKKVILHETPISECIAGLLLIEGLEFVSFSHNPKLGEDGGATLMKIINEHLNRRDNYNSHICAEELGQAGFEDLLEL